MWSYQCSNCKNVIHEEVRLSEWRCPCGQFYDYDGGRFLTDRETRCQHVTAGAAAQCWLQLRTHPTGNALTIAICKPCAVATGVFVIGTFGALDLGPVPESKVES